MAEEDYLAELIKKVKQSKKQGSESTETAKKATLGAEIPKEVEAIKKPSAAQKPAEEILEKPVSAAQKNAAAAQKATKEEPAQAPPKEEHAQIPAETKIPSAIPKPVEIHAQREEVQEKSTAEKEIERSPKKKVIEKYGNVTVYKVPGKPLPYYVVPVARPTMQEKAIINTIKEAATRLIAITPYKIRNLEQRRAVYKQRVLEILRNSPELHIPERRFDFYAESVVREMVGYGIIDPLVMDDRLEEIMVIGAKRPVYLFHRKYEMMSSNIEFFSDKEIIDLINRIARNVGRRVDISNPLLDARMPDGSRINATIPPASVEGATLTVRKFRKDPFSVIDLINNNTLSTEVAAFLWLCVDGLGAKPANILIAGGTSSGKTTTLNVLASFIPETERIISIEDTAELALPLMHWVRMEAKPPGLEGKGELTLDILTKNSLRMRPDRIIVGEVRHDEAFTLFTALNTGHDGALKGDSLIQFSDGDICEIGEFADREFKEGFAVKEGNYEFVEIKGKGIMVPSLSKESLQIEHKRVTHVWRKKTAEKLCKIRLRSGKELILTKDHPVYRISNGVQEINAGEAKKGDFIAMPAEVEAVADKELMRPYLTGMIYGDGHLGYEAIQFVNKEETLLQKFQQEMGEVSSNKVARFDYDGFSRVQVHDKKFIRAMQREYGMPVGNKTKIFKFDERVLTAGKKDLALLIKALFDCEAHVNLKANCIQFSTSNKDVAKKMPMILARFGIISSTYAQEKDGKGNTGPYYRISIYGKDNLERFKQEIGFLHKGKKNKLAKLVEKSKDSLDLFPNLERVLRRARAENGLSQGEMGALLGTSTPSTVNSYENKARKPSRKQLKKICEILEGDTAKQIEIMANSNMKFERIVSAEEEEFEGHVYDLTVEGNHNYLANGVIVSNCLGTIHANSPQETIVRITSPPMNVPEVMLSGLDLILIEHKIHDKRKGTIRRITEIAEVSGVLLKRAQTQTIFMRDPVTDTLERTNVPIRFIKILQDFTGLSRKTVMDDWKERQVFLEKLRKKGIRDIEKIKDETRKFSMRRY